MQLAKREFLIYKKQKLRENIAQDRKKLLKILGKKCLVCSSEDSFLLQIHHVKPLSEYGDNDLENLIPVCPNCHFVIHKYLRASRKLKKIKEEEQAGVLSSAKETHIALWRKAKSIPFGKILDYFLKYNDLEKTMVLFQTINGGLDE